MVQIVQQPHLATPAFRQSSGATVGNRVVLFLNDNVGSALFAQDIVPKMIQQGLEPVLVVLHPQVPEKAKISELQDFAFFDGKITKSFKFLPVNPTAYEKFNVSNQNLDVSDHFINLAQVNALSLYSVLNANESIEIDKLIASEEVIGAISIRNLQIFTQDFIDKFHAKNAFLWNLHSGSLPKYRGVHPLLRAMAHGERESHWTLHEIDRGIDTGKIIDSHSIAIDYDNAYMTEFYRGIPSASHMIVNAINNSKNGRLTTYQNELDKGNYYSFPTAEEINNFENTGIRMVDHTAMLTIYKKLLADLPELTRVSVERSIENVVDAYRDGHRKPSSPQPSYGRRASDPDKLTA